MAKLHARYWKYDGNHSAGHDCERYDPHGFGLDLIAYMAYASEQEYWINGVCMDGVVVRHHKSDGFGHQVHVAATAEQWEAAKESWRMIIEAEESRYEAELADYEAELAEENSWR